MMKFAATTIFLTLIFSLCTVAAETDQQVQNNASAENSVWQKLAEGLELGIFNSPLPSEIGDSKLRILRIDPQHFELRLLNASAIEDGRPLSVKEWSRQNGLVAAINASMYQADYKSSVSLMRTKAHVNNPRLSKDMAILAFDRKQSDVPRVKIIDRQCEDFENWNKKYDTVIQSIRMISCTGKNVWTQQPQKWSTAAIGVDDRDRVLFMHVGSPYSTHDVIDILKKLPLNIARAMYTEGGPQAQLYINIGEHEYEFVGNYEIELQGNMKKLISRPVPNVVGISLKAKKKSGEFGK
ncbi:MAG: phosphodiester glycosidase family protein [Desulfobacterales bacterium]|nr:MAG: phosphodiester glycosidase family protein [Desulfobacterales bacterium]